MVDVVIIGGGPAGITAGVVLQRKGYKTCIIDNQTFPREKLCAGVLTTKAVNLLQHVYKGINMDLLGIKYIDKVMMFYKKKIIGKFTIKNKYGVVSRLNFDNELLKYYKDVGGLVLDGEKSYQIIYDENKVKLSNGKEIAYHCLIGADGINSRVRTYVQRKWKTSILCFEKFILNDLKEDTIKIYFGEMLGGYSWRIPGKDRVRVGLGEFYVRGMKRDVKKYANYFGTQGVDSQEKNIGAFVSSGYFIKRPVKNNVILAGDAAGMVDAMTGEGIFFAMESGKQAALAISDFLEKGIPLSGYIRRIRKIHIKMREQSKYNKLLYIPGFQQICIKYMKENPNFVLNVLDNAISSYESGYTKEIIKNIFHNK